MEARYIFTGGEVLHSLLACAHACTSVYNPTKLRLKSQSIGVAYMGEYVLIVEEIRTSLVAKLNKCSKVLGCVLFDVNLCLGCALIQRVNASLMV